MTDEDQQIRAILEQEFSVTVVDVQTPRDSVTTYAKFQLSDGRILTVEAAWDVSSTIESVAADLAKRSREHTSRVDQYDPNDDVWKTLRSGGHELGEPYIQEGGGLRVVVDGVAMSVRDARAVAEKRATVAQVAEARDGRD